MDIDYKIKLILIYLNTVGEEYTYKEIAMFMGLGYNVIDELIEQMEKEYLIFKNEYCIVSISTKGFKLLEENNLLNANIYDIYDDLEVSDTISIEKIDIEDIYIPKKFDKQFKGYK